MKNKKKKLNIILLIIILLILITIFFLSSYILKNKKEVETNDQLIAETFNLKKVKSHYSDYVRLQDATVIYIKSAGKYTQVSTVYGNIEVSLDKNYEIVDEYFKLLNSDYYIKYNSGEKIEDLTKLTGEYKYYKNYIPYNENIILKKNAKLYVDETNYYEVIGGSYAIIIKDTNKYGIEYNNSLVYVNKEDVEEIISNNNTNDQITDGLSILNYHFVVSGTNENGELEECQQSICITDTMFETHIKYLKDNNYYSVSMRDLELFIDGKINLPLKSIGITIDDGWYVARSIKVLEKYQMLGTLFLIGSLASPNDYASNYLEVHSHTWNMHTGNDCSADIGRSGILCLSDNTILDDLKKSRESLNNTTYFCYPFYEYNQRAIELLKKAGFTMAFAGQIEDSKVRVGQDKYRVPRYVIANYTTMDTFIRYVS